MNPEEKATFANHEIDEYQKLSGEAAGQSNETLRFLSGQLILIAATIITVSAAFVASGYQGHPLNLTAKQLLLAIWIALAISITFGIADIIVTAKFFTRWQIYHYKMAEELSVANYKSSVNDIIKAARSKLKDIKPQPESPHWLLYVQVGCLAIGLLTFLVLIMIVLLK
jgi:hypothetical protein